MRKFVFYYIVWNLYNLKSKHLILVIGNDYCLADFGGMKQTKNTLNLSKVLTSKMAATAMYASPELKQQLNEFNTSNRTEFDVSG